MTNKIVRIGNAEYLIKSNDDLDDRMVRRLASIEHILDPDYNGKFTIVTTLDIAQETIHEAVSFLRHRSEQ